MRTFRAPALRPRSMALVALGAVSIVAVLLVGSCTGPQPADPPPTAVVDRGQVATLVSASGTLVAVSEQNLGFPEGGELAEVLVAVGDRVEAGQVLARLDDFVLARTRDQRQAQLDQARAQLDKLVNGNSVESADESLEQARSVLEATIEQADATNNSNEEATEQARRQLDFDREAVERAEDDLAEAEADCDAEEAGSGGTEDSNTETVSTTEGEEQTTDDADNDTGGSDTGGTGTSTSGSACDQVATAESTLQSAERTVLTSESSLSTAEQREITDAASGRVSIANAEQQVATAEGNLGSAESDRPADVDAQEAAVAEAEAGLALAQRDVDDATLRAPVAGTVAELNGVVGEFVAAASGTTALAPGSLARLPQSTDSGTGGATASAPFIRLDNVDSFQLVVPFEESDAARLAVNQQVQVGVDAVPDLEQTGTVLAISPTAEDVSGIVNYYTTIVLTNGDQRLKDGQTAEAGVVVEAVENVLRVPATAVQVEPDGQRTVEVAGENGEPVVTPFQAGLVGDEFVEVRSGLRDGQQVLLPQAEVSASTGGGPPS